MSVASRANRYKQLLREAGKRLGCKPSDDRCQHFAMLSMTREAAIAKLIAGKDVDASAMLKLDESLRTLMPVEVPNIQIAFVRPLHEHCRKCGKSQEFICRACGHHEMAEEDANRRPPSGAETATTHHAKPVAVPSATVESSPAAPNIVELRPRSIHDRSAPLQTYSDP